MNTFNAKDYTNGQLLKIQLNPKHVWYDEYPAPFVGRIVDASEDDSTCIAVESVRESARHHYVAVSAIPSDISWHGEILEVIEEEE